MNFLSNLYLHFTFAECDAGLFTLSRTYAKENEFIYGCIPYLRARASSSYLDNKLTGQIVWFIEKD